MKPINEPEFDVYERDGWFFVSGLTGGFAIGGYRHRMQAECYAENLKYMYLVGWQAREEKLRELLGLHACR